MSTRFLIALGKALKHFRLRKKWSQVELVRAINAQDSLGDDVPLIGKSDDHTGVTQGYLSKIECGRGQLTNRKMKLIVDTLGVTMKQVWSLAEEFEKGDLDCRDPQEFLNCLVATDIPANEVEGLVAEVDVRTIAIFQNLTAKVVSGEFCKADLRKLADMLERVSSEPTVQLRNYSREVAEITKVMGERLVSMRNERERVDL